MNIENLFTAVGIMSLIIVSGLIITYYIQKYIFSEPKTKMPVEKSAETEKPVPCEGCKCLINKSDARVVNISGYYYSEFCPEFYYCEKCKPQYTRVVFRYNNPSKYYKEFEVDVNGKLIK